MKTLFFDLLGVIFPNKAGPDEDNTKKLYEYMGKDIEYNEFADRFYEFTKSYLSSDEFWQSEPEKYKNIESTFLNTYEIHEGIHTILDQLAPDFRLSVISNHPQAWIDYLLKKHNLDNYFVRIFSSGNTGYRKPDVRIFNEAIKGLNVEPSETYMIDDQNKNLISASEAHMQTIHVKVFNDTFPFKPDYEINDLAEILLIKQQLIST